MKLSERRENLRCKHAMKRKGGGGDLSYVLVISNRGNVHEENVLPTCVFI